MKKIFLSLALLSILCAEAHSQTFGYFYGASIAVGPDNLTHIAWYNNDKSTTVGTFQTNTNIGGYATTIAEANPVGPFPGWGFPKIGLGINTTLGWFNPGTSQYSEWQLDSTNNLQYSSIFQLVSPGSADSPTIGTPNWYGYQVDINGNGMFGFEWEIGKPIRIGTTVITARTGTYEDYIANTQTFSANFTTPFGSSQKSIGLADLDMLNSTLPTGRAVNLSQSYVTNETQLSMMGATSPFAYQPTTLVDQAAIPGPLGGLWQPVAVTTTTNFHMQIVWVNTVNASASNSTVKHSQFATWDIDPVGNIHTVHSTDMQNWVFMAAAACPLGGDGQVRTLWFYTGPGNYGYAIFTFDPATGDMTEADNIPVLFID